MKVLNNEARELIKKRLDEIKEDQSNSFNLISFELSEILNEIKLMQKSLEEKKHLFQFGGKYKKKEFLLSK